MLARFDIALTKQDYVSGLDAATQELGRRDPYRDRRIWEQLGAGVVLLLVLLAIFRDAGLAVVVTALAEACLLAALGSRWVRRSYGVSYDPATAQFTAEFTDKGIVEQYSDRSRNWKWAAVRQIHDTGAVLVIELDGWDMLILPYRLWADDAARNAFLRETRALVPPRDAPAAPTDVSAPLEARDQLVVGAIGAGVDFAFAFLVLVEPAGRGGSISMAVFQLAIGAALAYFAYRLARYCLPKLYGVYPRIALTISYALVLAVPLYIGAAYMRWV